MGYLSICITCSRHFNVDRMQPPPPLALLGELIFIKEDGDDLLLGGINYQVWGSYNPLQTHYHCCLVIVTFQVGQNFPTFYTKKFKYFCLTHFFNFNYPQSAKTITLPLWAGLRGASYRQIYWNIDSITGSLTN